MKRRIIVIVCISLLIEALLVLIPRTDKIR